MIVISEWNKVRELRDKAARRARPENQQRAWWKISLYHCMARLWNNSIQDLSRLQLILAKNRPLSLTYSKDTNHSLFSFYMPLKMDLSKTKVH